MPRKAVCGREETGAATGRVRKGKKMMREMPGDWMVDLDLPPGFFTTEDPDFLFLNYRSGSGYATKIKLVAVFARNAKLAEIVKECREYLERIRKEG